MLPDVVVEEEEPWCAQKDLEHDLHLAAELGKSLLERNKDLEQGLQQIYSTNQEQLQEIEYLTKQVDLLRQVNEQHAKVYEQLDSSAREQEQSNQRLGLDNRTAQQKIQRLMEMVEGLQGQVEELQHELQQLKSVPQRPQETRGRCNTHSMSCLKEPRNTLRCCDQDCEEQPDGLLVAPSELAWREAEQASLRRSLRSLQTQLATERARREQAESEADVLASEHAALERQLGMMEGCRARVAELECEAAELRQLWRAEYSARSHGTCHAAPPTLLFLNPDEEESEGEDEEAIAVQSLRALRCCEGEWVSGPPGDAAERRTHMHACVRCSEAVKYRGVSLLNEVDLQYSALQVKYEDLLRRCSAAGQCGDVEGLSHKAIQTAAACPRTAAACPRTAACTDMEHLTDDFRQPEYKALFKEIFTCIQRTKEDLSETSEKAPADQMVLLLK